MKKKCEDFLCEVPRENGEGDEFDDNSQTQNFHIEISIPKKQFWYGTIMYR